MANIFDLYEPADPVDLYTAADELEMPWAQSLQPSQAPQNLSQRIQEVLGAREPDQGGIAHDILSGRFDSGSGPSFGDYGRGVVNSALGKPQIGDDSRVNSIMKTLSLVNSLESQNSNANFRNLQLQETMRHNRAAEGLMRDRINATGNKPIPATALKMQNEGLDIIGTVGGINADLNAARDQITQGKLSFGPVSNKVNEFKNWAGMSDEGSGNYASFISNLEKLRNDSLRLNKGVQTEGDAVRAWNELFANLNDDRIVNDRIQEITALNSRASDLQKLNIDNIRANYGHDPLDYTQYEKRPAALGAAYAPTTPAGQIKFLGFE